VRVVSGWAWETSSAIFYAENLVNRKTG